LATYNHLWQFRYSYSFSSLFVLILRNLGAMSLVPGDQVCVTLNRETRLPAPFAFLVCLQDYLTRLEDSWIVAGFSEV
jgi:hypothetical protein